MTETIITAADFATHLFHGRPQYGYGWFDITVVRPKVLFIPDGTPKLRVETNFGRIIRVEGGRLTEAGTAFYAAIAQAATDIAPSGSFQIWTDNPEIRLRFQQIQYWETGTQAERDDMAKQIRDVMRRFGCTNFGDAPPRE